MKKYNHYNIKLKDRAWELRNESISKAEKYIWKSLLSRGRIGAQFKRQRPIDRFIVDFFCQEVKLIVEIDGSSHFSNPSYDRYRQERLENLGYHFLRFTEGEVLNCIDDISIKIEHAIHVLRSTDLPLNPPPKGE
ncbi:endonuclease domain-containing protein [Paracrocinitomix mangrovi]|uniref:endonuclease domain-containing protein n=1 Tax=Paracrocinitomix mangrovi TaxID=2862509 RepID=UPI001C8E3FEA|nr:endonuclease domain-containing protein [Paracrocinitomix mangrovi]UKN00825.1 endonuclease domain-containing protein [Paracrocinitomix mangrovi]